MGFLFCFVVLCGCCCFFYLSSCLFSQLSYFLISSELLFIGLGLLFHFSVFGSNLLCFFHPIYIYLLFFLHSISAHNPLTIIFSMFHVATFNNNMLLVDINDTFAIRRMSGRHYLPLIGCANNRNCYFFFYSFHRTCSGIF